MFQDDIKVMKTEEFQKLAQEFKDAQRLADKILDEIMSKYTTEHTTWWVNLNCDILPQHKSLDQPLDAE